MMAVCDRLIASGVPIPFLEKIQDVLIEQFQVQFANDSVRFSNLFWSAEKAKWFESTIVALLAVMVSGNVDASVRLSVLDGLYCVHVDVVRRA